MGSSGKSQRDRGALLLSLQIMELPHRVKFGTHVQPRSFHPLYGLSEAAIDSNSLIIRESRVYSSGLTPGAGDTRSVTALFRDNQFFHNARQAGCSGSDIPDNGLTNAANKQEGSE